MITQFTIDTYNDVEKIKGAVEILRKQYPAKPASKDEIVFDNKGNLENYIPDRIYDYKAGGWIANPVKPVMKQNMEFVDAIRFERIAIWKPRNGVVMFTHIDGRETHMCPPDFEEIIPKLVRGWIIGSFKYRKFYGAWHIQCTEVLV